MTHKLIKVSMVFIMIFGLLFSVGNSIYASETATRQTAVLSEQEQTEQAIESLKFYLEEAGHVDLATNRYVITDFYALKARAELPGDIGLEGKFIFENYVLPSMTRDLGAYAACVVINSVPFGGIIWDALQGRNMIELLTNALVSQNYGEAVNIIKGIAKSVLKPSQLAKFNVAVVVAGVALNAISCWGT